MGILNRFKEHFSVENQMERSKDRETKDRRIRETKEYELEKMKKQNKSLEEKKQLSDALRKEKQKRNDYRYAPVKNVISNVQKNIKKVKESRRPKVRTGRVKPLENRSIFGGGGSNNNNPFMSSGNSPFMTKEKTKKRR